MRDKISEFRGFINSGKSHKVERLNEEQFKNVLKLFYKRAELQGFFVDLETAIEKRGYYFTHPQREIAEAILHAVFTKTPSTISISITRQFGKTELVVLCLSFCFEHFFDLIGEPFKCIIVAPEKGTASEVFNRAVNYIYQTGVELLVDRANRKEMITGDSLVLFGIFDTSSGTIEGRTANLIIRDEAHLGNDEIFADQVLPTIFRTEGSVILIGNAGYKDCLYREYLAKGTCDITDDNGNVVGKNIVFRYPYNKLKPYMKALSDKGLTSAGSWIKAIEKYIKDRGGEKSYNVIKNVFCQWITSFGNFLTNEQLKDSIKTIDAASDVTRKDCELYVGVDFASSGDRTIATVMNEKREIIDWLVVKDNNSILDLREQCEILRNWCDANKYTSKIVALGGDATGMGIGAIEMLEEEFGTTIFSRVFTQKWKHEIYIMIRDLFITKNTLDRIWLPEGHAMLPLFKKDITELTVNVASNGMLTFSAPNKQNCYDDFVASLAITLSMLVDGVRVFRSPVSKEKRIPPFVEKVINRKIDPFYAMCGTIRASRQQTLCRFQP